VSATTTISQAGARKAAIMLVQLGQDRAAKVLAHLPEEELEAVSAEIARLDTLPAGEAESVLTEFHQLAIGQGDIVRGGPSLARALLEQSLGKERAGAIMSRVSPLSKPRPFAALGRADAKQLVAALTDEHPQVVAVVVAHLPGDKATAVLTSLGPELQADVAHRLAVMETPASDVVATLERRLETRLASALEAADTAKVGGIAPLVAIINRADRATERLILEALEARDPALADEVRAQMFTFEDIVTLEDRDLQLVLRDLDTGALVIALKGVSQQVRDKVTGNMSERAATALIEDMELAGRVPARKVEEAQRTVVLAIRALEDAGQVTLRRDPDDEYVD
jgi:flagellar motor switch protein FliG